MKMEEGSKNMVGFMGKGRKVVDKGAILLICALFCIVRTQAQDNPAAQIKDALVEHQQHSLQEKIYAHTNKDYYLTGELIWFKLYDVDASFHHPLDISKVAYIELLDSLNKPVLQGKIAMQDGLGKGSFYLPTTLNSGIYKLRAYTNWMKNYDVDFFFEKIIPIVNSQKVLDLPPDKKEMLPVIHFFPEGGNMVYGINSKVAFKAVGPSGSGIDCQGYVLDESNDTVVRFKSLQFGMGSFDFMPLIAHQYHASFIMSTGMKLNIALPEIFKEGYVLRVMKNESHQLVVNVAANMTSPGEVYLVVHTRESVKVAERAVFQNGQTRFLIDAGILGDGVSHFTIFNSKRQPVCERLYFSQPKRVLQIQLVASEPVYGIRKKIDLTISASDENAKLTMAEMSLSVFRLDSLQTAIESNISSYLWLSSELKGNIESPGYYFNQPTNQGAEAADNLMLTQGWRRFDWTKVLAHEKPIVEFPPEYNGHIIVGNIKNSKIDSVARNITGYLSIPSIRPRVLASVSDSGGLVKFETKDIFGTSGLIAQTNPADDSASRIDIANPFSEKYGDNKLPPLKLTENYKNTILDQSISMQVQNIWLAEKLAAFDNSATDTSAFFRKPSQTYLLDKFTRFTTLEEVLREYVQLTSVRIRKGVFHLQVADVRRSQFFDGEPLVLLDGVPMFDMNKFMAYDPLKIKKLDLLNERYFENSTSYDGILSFTTYKGSLPDFEFDPHVTVVDYDGLQLQREFYSPVYDTEQKRASNFPDFRNALYWSPDVKTDSSGKQQISFYTGDLPGKFAVVVQGLTKDGRSGSQVIQIEVKE
jgi:hypothetical protein